jgi:AAA domain/Toprim-like
VGRCRERRPGFSKVTSVDISQPTIEKIRASFPKGEMHGTEFVTFCPIHNDRNNPNLHISIENGKLLAHCNAGCPQETVFAAVTSRLNSEPKTSSTESQWNFTLPQLESAQAHLGKAQDFLSSRGITLETARHLRFGFDNGRLVMPTFIEGELVAVKFRTLDPANRGDKWRKLNRDKGVYHLFNHDSAIFAKDLYVVESELDCAMLISLGFTAVSVDSANHKLTPEGSELLKGAGRVILALDTDLPGQSCANRFEEELAVVKPLRIIPQGVKDLGELYASGPAEFAARLEQLKEEAANRPPLWRTKFHTPEELPEGEIEMLIEGVLPKGVNFVGALSGVGKTWWCLSQSRALTTGTKFLGNWAVPNPVNVLYLCPEMNAKAFKRRLQRFGISKRFYCQTISDGAPLNLSDSLLMQAIRDLQPVVFLDTAIRFAGAEDENSSSQNANGLAKAIFTLIHLGAQAVVCLHHRAKETAKVEEMTLENVLRGTGDLGAMCDAVWGLQCDRGPNNSAEYLKESKDLLRLAVKCVKGRDFRPPEDFRVQLEPYIETIGDFAMLANESEANRQNEIEKLDSAIVANPRATKVELEQQTGVGRNRIEKLAAQRGWAYNRKNGWARGTT